jgi:hypothetical protein
VKEIIDEMVAEFSQTIGALNRDYRIS